MSTLTLVATQPLNVSSGALLDAQDPYTPVLADGRLHPEDQAHYDNGRLVVQDDRKVNDKGFVVGKAPELPKIPEPAASGKQEA